MYRSFAFPTLISVVIALGIINNTAAESRLALLIGNDSYLGEPLATCINDARGVSEWLQSIGYKPADVELLVDANRAEMVAGLKNLLEKCRQQRPQQVVIFYSGHGYYLPDDDGDEGPDDKLDEAFVGVFTEPLQRENQIADVVLRDDDFYESIREIRGHCQQLIVILDCCFSGGGVKSLGDRAQAALAGPEKRLTPAAFFRKPPKSVAGDKSALKPRNIERQPPEPEWQALDNGAPGAPLLVLAASNQFQPAQAGVPPTEPFSKFTAALLNLLTEPTADSPPLRLDASESKLTATLEKIPQHPQVFAAGIPRNIDLVPGVFPIADPQPVPNQRFIADLVHSLFTLPADNKEPWELKVSTTKPSPIVIGEKYALTVLAPEDGFLVVVTVEANGRIALQFPNQYRPNTEIAAGQELVVPYPDAFKAIPPAGTDRFFVFWLDQKPLKGVNFATEGAATIDTDQLLKWYPELRNELKNDDGAKNALARGIRVRARNQPAGRAPHWARAISDVQTIAAPNP